MAKVLTTKKVKGPVKAGKGGLALKRKGGLPEVSLPTEPTELSKDIRDFSMLIHGEKKIGKTSLLAQEPGTLFLEFDPLQKGVSIYQRQVPDWPHFLAYIKLCEEQVAAGKFKFRNIVIDGVDLMYKYCFKWSCKQMVIEHPNDENDFGKSWNVINGNYREAFLRLRNLPGVAIRLVCHSKWHETKTRGGGSTEKLVPTLTASAEEALVGDIDIWAAYAYDGKRHVLIVKGDERTGAGHRVDHAFRTPEGEMVEEIDLGDSPQEAYRRLVAAFENQQTYTTIEELKEQLKSKKQKQGPGKKLVLKVRRR